MSGRSEELQREDYPMPSTAEGVLELVRQILAQPGAVEKIVIENKQPVRVHRWVEPDPMHEGPITLDGALRNSEMIEHVPVDGESVASTLVKMVSRVQYERLSPMCWVTGPNVERVLSTWLSSVVALDPEETLILCAAGVKDADFKDIKVTVKTAIELRGESHGDSSRTVAHSVRDRATERITAVTEVGLVGPGGGGEGWKPGRLLSGRMGKR
jgi:hypothetical protein